MAPATTASNEPPARGYFRDRTVVITGASSGIGEDVALAFARQGARVALLARRKSMLEDLAGRIEATGGRALAIACDVTRRADVDTAIAQVTHSFRRVNILVNSAGIMLPAPVEKLKLADLERMMSVNVYGALNTIQAAIPILRRQGSGNIINIASLAGRRGMSPLGGYCATKFAMVGLTEALRMELFGSGIRISLVMPGVIDTPMTTDAVIEDMEFGGMPSLFKMPVRWVTWAVLAAAAFGLTEVDVPPGAAVGEKIAALFPGMTDAFLSVGTQMMKAAGRFVSKAPKAGPEEEQHNPHSHKRAG
jgi:NADP-dependent 3-hydroxy acid dehydrogenase YdfG